MMRSARPDAAVGIAPGVALILGATVLAVAVVERITTDAGSVATFSGLDPVESLGTLLIAAVDYDPNSGLPVGFVQRGPVRILKRIDAASIPLRAAMNAQQPFDTVTIEYSRFDIASGDFVRYFGVTLNHVVVTGIQTTFPSPVDASPGRQTVLEAVELHFERMTVEVTPPAGPPDEPPNGDGNYDGNVSLRDAAGLQRCFNPLDPAQLTCAYSFDLDANHFVDLGDVPLFNYAMRGP